MACAEILRQLLVEEKGRGKTALVVGRTHSHVRDQLMPIFEQILSNRDKRGKENGIAQNEYRVVRAAPMVIHLPFGPFWAMAYSRV